MFHIACKLKQKISQSIHVRREHVQKAGLLCRSAPTFMATWWRSDGSTAHRHRLPAGHFSVAAPRNFLSCSNHKIEIRIHWLEKRGPLFTQRVEAKLAVAKARSDTCSRRLSGVIVKGLKLPISGSSVQFDQKTNTPR